MLGQTFINVMDVVMGADPDPVPFRHLATLSARLNALARELTRDRRWTLYLARDGELSESVDLPTHLSLEFAPRAKVRLTVGVTLTVRGTVDLGREVRFVANDLLCRVRLLGPLDAIFPAWWESPRPDQGDVCVMRAVEAVRDRTDLDLPLVPIVLDRPFHLSAPIMIRRDPTPTDREQREFIFQGRHPLGSAALRASLFSESVETLVRVLGRARVRFEDVGFSTRSSPQRASTAPAALVELVGDIDGTGFVRCTFEANHQSFVRIRHLPTIATTEYALVSEQLDGREPATRTERELIDREVGGGRAAMVWISACTMTRAGHLVSEDGVAVLRGALVLLTVTSSSFVSNTGAVLAIAQGTAQIEDCRFSRAPGAKAGTDTLLAGTKVSSLGAGVFTGGLWPALLVGEAREILLRPGRRLGGCPVSLPPTNVIATHLQIEGLSALEGSPVIDQITELNVTMNNVVQRSTAPGEYSINLLGPGARGVLTLNGCTLDGYVRVFDDTTSDFEVVDVGTRLPLGASFETSRAVRRLPTTAPASR